MWNASSRKPKTKSLFWPSARHSSCPQPPERGSRSPHVWAGHPDVPVGPAGGWQGGGHKGEAAPAPSLLSSRSVLIKNFPNQELAFCCGRRNLHKADTYPGAEGRDCWVCSGSLSHFLPLLPPVLPCPGTSAMARGAKSCWWLQWHPRVPPLLLGACGGSVARPPPPGRVFNSSLGFPVLQGRINSPGCPCPPLCPIHLCPVPVSCLWNGAAQKGQRKGRKRRERKREREKGREKKTKPPNKKKIKNQPKVAVGNQKSELRHFGSRGWNV